MAIISEIDIELKISSTILFYSLWQMIKRVDTNNIPRIGNINNLH